MIDYKTLALEAALNALKNYVQIEFEQIEGCSNIEITCQRTGTLYASEGMSDVKGTFTYTYFNLKTFEQSVYNLQFNFSKSGGEFYGSMPDGEWTTSRNVQSHINKIDKVIKKLNK